MTGQIRELYLQEVDRGALDFEGDPGYQLYLTRCRPLWEGGDMPEALFHLLDESNFLSFAHGFRLGIALMKWADR